MPERRRALRQATSDDTHVAKHLPGTAEANRLIEREGGAHVFNDRATMDRVTEAILDRGEYLGAIRAHDRWGLRFAGPIGARLAADGTAVPLHYGELTVNPRIGRYHVIPRTGPSAL